MRKLKVASLIAVFMPLAAMWPAAAAAQSPAPLAEPDSIPLALALALSTTAAFAKEPQIMVGAMPDWVATKLALPANARVLGSSFLGTTAVAVVSVSVSPANAIADAKANLLAHGWTSPPPPPTIAIGGFRQAPPTPAAGAANRVTLCGDHQVLNTAARAAGASGTIVTYHMVTAAGYSACHLPQLPDLAALSPGRFPWPTLYNPPGATDAQAAVDCGNGGFSLPAPSSTVESPISSDSLLDYYGKQLADSGWKSQGGHDQLVSSTWTRTNASGATVIATIAVRPMMRNAGCRETSMEVRTINKP
jgi:hypothetical protein